MAAPFRHEIRVKVSKIFDKEIRPGGFQFLSGCDPGTDGDRENMVFACGPNVLRCVPNESDRGVTFNQLFTPRAVNRDTCKTPTGRRHFAESAKPEKAVESRAGQLPPSDARQVAGDEGKRRAGIRQLAKNVRSARTRATSQIRSDVFIDLLCALNDPGHERRGAMGFDACCLHHEIQDVGIEHAVNRNPVRGSFDSRHVAHGFHQGLPVIRTGAANQCAVNIEENKGASQLTVYGPGGLDQRTVK